MAPIGGGGNPVGPTFSGITSALTVIENHIYGYSGLVGVDNTETYLLDASTGNYYAKVKVLFSYATDEPAGDDFIYRIRLNEVITWQLLVPHSEAHYAQRNNINIILPPFTRVQCSAQNDDTSTLHNQLVVLAGRIYN